MMVRFVGIVAVLVLSACGVGVDDPDLATPGSDVGASQSTLMGCVDPITCVPSPTPLPPGSTVSAQVPGTIALPQDPIPWRPPVTVTERVVAPGVLPELPRR